jgi:hypothetical protein
MVYWRALLLNLMQRALGTATPDLFADLNFLIVNVRQQLTEVAHVEIYPADRQLPKRSASVSATASGSKPVPLLRIIIRPLDQTHTPGYQHPAALCDRHVDAGAALCVDQFDGLRHCVKIFSAVLHGFEAQAGPAVLIKFGFRSDLFACEWQKTRPQRGAVHWGRPVRTVVPRRLGT